MNHHMKTYLKFENRERQQAKTQSFFKKHLVIYYLFLVLAFSSGKAEKLLNPCVPKEVKTAKVIGPVPKDKSIYLSIELPIRNKKEWKSLYKKARDDKSNLCHHGMTEKEFEKKFAPSRNDYQALKNLVTANGLRVDYQSPDRKILGVTGTVADIQKAFHLHLNYYQKKDGTKFRAPDREPTFNLNIPVLQILGLDDLGRIEGSPINKQSLPSKNKN